MAIHTHINEIIDYPSNVINALMNSPTVVGLIINNPKPDINGADGDKARAHMFDYDYVDETVLEAGAFVCVDTDMVAAPTGTIKDLELYVQIIVSKKYMDLDTKIWRGRKGNRRDNLAREIDLLLRGSREYGIGQLQLMSACTTNVPAAFTSKLLTYRIPNFAHDSNVGNE